MSWTQQQFEDRGGAPRFEYCEPPIDRPERDEDREPDEDDLQQARDHLNDAKAAQARRDDPERGQTGK